MVFSPEVVFVDAVVDEVPGEDFVVGPFPEDEKVGVQGTVAAGCGPVAASLVGGQQEVGHPAVAPGQEGLVVGPFGQIGVDPDARLALEFPLHPFDAVLQFGDAGKGGPLEGGEGFRHEGVEAEGNAGQVGSAGGGFGDGMLEVFG